MPYCIRCGKEIETGAQFCPYCGSSVMPNPRLDAINPIPANLSHPYISPLPSAGFQNSSPQPLPMKATAVLKNNQSKSVFGILGTSATAATLAGSFLPWISWPGYSRSGWSGDGKITFLVGIISVLFFVLSVILKTRWPYLICFLVSLFTAAVFVINIVNVIDKSGFSTLSSGLYIGAAGALFSVLFSILGLTVTN